MNRALMAAIAACFFLSAATLARMPVSHNLYQGDPVAAKAGAKLYGRYCAECHGALAEGKRGKPSLKSPGMKKLPPGVLFRILTNGVLRRGMPSWSRLPEQQRWQIVTYLQQINGN